jgi:hypothetical protein
MRADLDSGVRSMTPTRAVTPIREPRMQGRTQAHPIGQTRALLWALMAALMLALPAAVHSAQAEEAPGAVAGIIQGQLDAFAAGDETAAYGYAAPSIQRKFPDPDVFMTMVRSGYAPLVGPQAVEFLGYESRGDKAVQRVKVIAADGTPWMAHYFMRQMEDGSWRIAGCRLERLPGGTA